MTPQEKKRLSLLKDRRNCYGENDKSSRKAIRFRKRWVNRTFRRTEHQALDASDADAVEQNIGKIQKKEWKKAPDSPLGEKILREKAWKIEFRLHQEAIRRKDMIDRLRDFLMSHGVRGARLTVIMRRVTGITLDRNSTSLKLDIDTIDLLGRFLANEK